MADYRGPRANRMAKTLGLGLLAGGLLLGAHAGIASADDSPTGPDDPLCATMPADAVCQGGPYAQPPPAPPPPPALPTSPFDPICATMPGDGACAGGPYAPPPPPPPTDPLFGGMDGPHIPTDPMGGMGGLDGPHIPTAPMHPFGGMSDHPMGMGMAGMPGHI
jgi:hypothetical protein